jgi:hypothetical protein
MEALIWSAGGANLQSGKKFGISEAAAFSFTQKIRVMSVCTPCSRAPGSANVC